MPEPNWKRFEQFTEALARRALEAVGCRGVEVVPCLTGTQEGRDVDVRYIDARNRPIRIFLECKYYTSGLVEVADLEQKITQLLTHGYQPHHWIILAPEKPLRNEAEKTIAYWRENPAIDFEIHRWDHGPNKDILKALFDQILAEPQRLHDPSWWASRAAQVTAIGQALCNLPVTRMCVYDNTLFLLTEALMHNGYDDPRHFFNLKTVSWKLLDGAQRWDVPRTIATEVRRAVEANPQPADRWLTAKVLTGESGNGKTTLLRRLAYDLFREGRPVWYLERVNGPPGPNLAEFLRRAVQWRRQQPPILICDWLDERDDHFGSYPWLITFARILQGLGVQGIALCAAPDVAWLRLDDTNQIDDELIGFQPLKALATKPDHQEQGSLVDLVARVTQRPEQQLKKTVKDIPGFLYLMQMTSEPQTTVNLAEQVMARKLYHDHSRLPVQDQTAHAWVILAARYLQGISSTLLCALLQSDPNQTPNFRIPVAEDPWVLNAKPLEMALVEQRGSWYTTHAAKAQLLWPALEKKHLQTMRAQLTALSLDDALAKQAMILGRALVRGQDTTGIGLQLVEKVKATASVWQVHAFLELGKAKAASGRIHEAETLFREYLKLDPNGLHPRLELGKLLAASGRIHEAETLFRETLHLDPNGLHPRLELGKLLAASGRIHEAETLFRETLHLDPNGLHPRLELGKLLAASGRIHEAETLFRETLHLEPNGLHPRLELGKLLAASGRIHQAETLFREYIQLDPNGLHPRLELGKLLAASGRTHEAETLFRETLHLDPNGLHPRLELGKLLAASGRTHEAETLFRETLHLDPNGLHPRLELGKLLAASGRTHEAETLFRECIQLDPNGLHPRLELGKLLAASGRIHEAETLFREYIQLDPNGLHPRLELGTLLMAQNNLDAAEEQCQHCLELAPDNAYAVGKLVEIFKKQRRPQDAFNLVRTFAQDHQPDPHILQVLGLTLFHSANRALALHLLTRSYVMEQQNPIAWRIMTHHALVMGGAFLRHMTPYIEDGPYHRLRGWEPDEIAQRLAQCRDEEPDGPILSGVISPGGFRLWQRFFIQPDDEGRDVFAHWSEWMGPEQAQPGMRVIFGKRDPFSGNKNRAIDIRPEHRPRFNPEDPMVWPDDPGIDPPNH